MEDNVRDYFGQLFAPKKSYYNAMQQMDLDKAPSMDCFDLSLYKQFWDS